MALVARRTPGRVLSVTWPLTVLAVGCQILSGGDDLTTTGSGTGGAGAGGAGGSIIVGGAGGTAGSGLGAGGPLPCTLDWRDRDSYLIDDDGMFSWQRVAGAAPTTAGGVVAGANLLGPNTEGLVGAYLLLLDANEPPALIQPPTSEPMGEILDVATGDERVFVLFSDPAGRTWLAAYDETFGLLWERFITMESNSSQAALRKVAAGDDGSVYVLGITTGAGVALRWEEDTGAPSAPIFDYKSLPTFSTFVLRVNPSGGDAEVAFVVEGDTDPVDLSADHGQFAVAGGYQGGITAARWDQDVETLIGGPSSSNGEDAFVAVLSKDNDYLVVASSSGDDKSSAVVSVKNELTVASLVAGQGASLVTYETENDIPQPPLAGATGAHLVRLDGTGNVDGRFGLNAPRDLLINDLAADPCGLLEGVLLVGHYRSEAVAELQLPASPQTRRAFTARMNTLLELDESVVLDAYEPTADAVQLLIKGTGTASVAQETGNDPADKDILMIPVLQPVLP